MSKRNRKKQVSRSGGAGTSSSTFDFETQLIGAIGQNEYNMLKPTIEESQLLYQNAKYYYSVNEFVGALVSLLIQPLHNYKASIKT